MKPSKILQIRLTQEEHAQLKQLAEEDTRKVSAWARLWLLRVARGEVTHTKPKEAKC